MNWLEAEQAVLDLARGATGVGVNWVVQSTLLISAGLAVGALCHKRGSAVQSAIYRTTLAAVLACPLVTWGLSSLGVSGWSFAMPAAYTYEELDATPAAEAIGALAGAGSNAVGISQNADRAVLAEEPGGVGSPLPATLHGNVAPLLPESGDLGGAAILNADTTAPTAVKAETWLFAVHGFGLLATAVGLAWMAAAVWLVARLAVAWRRLHRIRRAGLCADATTTDMCRELAERMGVRPPAVVRSPYVPSPCLTGLRAPAVILPESDFSLPVRDVLIHELAHLRRGDCHWNLLRRAGTAVFWFQPLLWRLSTRLEATAEEVCDDYVVQWGGDRRGYAHRLVDIAELSSAPFAAAGVGMVSLRSMVGRRVARIMDTSRSLSTRVGRLLAMAVLVGGMFGTLAAGLVGVGGRTAEAQAKFDGDSAAEAEKAAVDEDVITVQGRVLDPTGKPLPGAGVYALRWYWDFGDPKPLAQTTADEVGRFEISYRKSQFAADAGRSNQWREAYIAGFADGFGPGWAEYDDLKPGEAAEVRLVNDDVPIEGRVVDLEGNPVVGATVEVGTLHATPHNDLSEWIQAIRAGESTASAYRAFSGTLPHFSPSRWPKLATDADGRFRLNGFGRERVVDVHVSGPTVVTQTLNIATRTMAPIVHPAYDFPGADSRTSYGANFQYAAAPSRPIEGVVRDAETGEPIAGVEIWSDQFAGQRISGIHTIKTKTDASGRYWLAGMPKGASNRIIVVPAELPYFTAGFDVPDPPGGDAAGLDVKLHRGAWVTGRVTDKTTGRGVPARMFYIPYPDNLEANRLAEFADNSHIMNVQDRYRTAADGSYRVVALPGRGVVAALAVMDPYPGGQGYDRIAALKDRDSFRKFGSALAPSEKHPTAVKEISVVGVDHKLNCDFALEQGRRVTIRAVDAAGQAIEGVVANGIQETYGGAEAVPAAGIDLVALRDDESRTVLLHQKKRRLGKGLHVKADEGTAGPITVTLEPCATVTGRLIDGVGEPVRGVSLRFDVATDNDYGKELERVTTDGDGRFKHEGVLPGLPYAIIAEGAKIEFVTVAKTIEVQPGEKVDLGDIDVTSKKRPKPMRVGTAVALSETRPASHALRVRGRVTGPDGKPAAGIAVAAMASRNDFRRGGEYTPPPTAVAEAKTDADGRYALTLAAVASSTHQGGKVIAGANGFGIAWKELDLNADEVEASFELKAEEPITGRLVDVDGQAAAGVPLDVRLIMVRLAKLDAAWNGVGINEGVSPAAWPQRIVTDDEGRFTIRRIPPGHGVSLAVEGSERFAPQDIAINTGMPEQRGERDGTYRSQVVKNDVKPGDAPALPLAPAQMFVGAVTYEDTGDPAPQARLSIWASQQDLGGSMTSVSGQTDAAGKYRISPRPGVRFGGTAYPPEGAPYLARQLDEVKWQGADREKQVSVALPRGVLVRGRVVEAVSGVPVAGAGVQYMPERANNTSLPQGTMYGWEGLQTCDSQGRYEIVVPPGPGRLLVHAPLSEYIVVETSDRELSMGLPGGQRVYAHAVQRIDPAAGDEPLDLTVRLTRGAKITGELFDEQEAPIESATIVSPLKTHPLAIHWVGHLTDEAKNGRFELAGLAPQREYVVHFLDAKRRLGTTAFLQAGMAPPRIVLQPCGSARMRILDGAGKPLADYDPTVHFVLKQGFERLGPMASEASKTGLLASDSDYISNVDRLNHPSFQKTDADGRLEISALIPGAKYRILLYGNKAYEVATDFKAEAGKTIDLGDLRVVTEETIADVAAAEPVGAPDTPKPAAMEGKRTVEPAATAAADGVGTAADSAGPENAPGKEVSGSVVGADGKPVSGAKLYWIAWSLRGQRPAPQLVATTGATGEFSFKQPSLAAASPGAPAMLVNQKLAVVAAGHGMFVGAPPQHNGPPQAIRAIAQALALGSRTATITLPADASIKGRIVNVEGEPVAGAHVWLRKLSDGNGPNSAAWRAKELEARGQTKNLKWRARVLGIVAEFAPPQLPACAPSATSDAQGRFELAGIGADRLVELLVEGDGIESKLVLARTNPGKAMTIEADDNFMLEDHTLYGPELTLVAGPSRPIEGRVLDIDTGEPIVGAIVRTYAVHGERLNTSRERQHLAAVTDREGRYLIAGLPIGDGNKLVAFTVGDEPYVPVGHEADTAKAEATLSLDFKLKRGVFAEGRAYDAVTEQPLTGDLSYYIFRNPEIERDIPGLRNAFVDEHYFTTTDGRFRVPVLAARGILAFRYSPADGSDVTRYPRGAGAEAIDGLEDIGGLKAYSTMTHYMIPANYTSVVEVAPQAGQRTLSVDFPLAVVARLTVRPVDEAGNALPGIEFHGRTEYRSWDTAQGTVCEVTGLVPGTSRKLTFFDRERNLAGAVTVDNTTPDGTEVTLVPAGRVQGRLVNEDGEPITDATLYPDYEDFDNDSQASIWPDDPRLLSRPSNLPVGKDGRFELVGLVAGWKYNANALATRTVDGARMQRGIGKVFTNVVVKAGEERDLGDLVVKSN